MSLTPVPDAPLDASGRRSQTPTAQLRSAKLRLANDIENLLDTFTKLTDLRVSDISVETVSTYNPTPSITPTYNRYIVTLRISL